MNGSRNQTFMKQTFQEQPSKIYFNRKQSVQLDKNSPQGSDRMAKQNYLSSYPIFESKRSKIINPPVPQQIFQQIEMQRKQSSFLKNYNQKLKRQRKRQMKLKSSLNVIRNTSQNNSVNNNRTLNPRDQIYNANNSISPNLSDHQSSNSSILVFRKTQFLDTLSNSFRQKKDYSKDSNLQTLLKQIYEIKNEQKKQIQKINQQKRTIQRQIIDKKKLNINTKQGYFTKYQRGFLLPMRRKMILKDQLSLKNQLSLNNQSIEHTQNSLIKYLSKQKIIPFSKSGNQKRLDKFYNFKHIQPWENSANKQHHQSLDSHFMFSNVQQQS